jgi:hypothetical protein
MMMMMMMWTMYYRKGRGKRVNSIKKTDIVPQPLQERFQNLQAFARASFNQYPATKPFSKSPTFFLRYLCGS